MCKIVINVPRKSLASKCFATREVAELFMQQCIEEQRQHIHPARYEIIKVMHSSSSKKFGYSVAYISNEIRIMRTTLTFSDKISDLAVTVVHIDQDILDHVVDSRMAMYCRNQRSAELEIENIRRQIDTTCVRTVKEEYGL